ncbi:hypothetical protein [Sphingomonas psychrotolerans]|uniref:Uncharacterized protein n=1 Tax=Sphingomonas psychrotolerans TaxID=1327635 RepID=A0A2K8MAA4_9SPHN|nr:hypothetical protein [Sphingomonas psychrotolerans]ATY30818.1 hypothetical protein CVN68_01460 [Sphingomonas psychrotolerans]
MHQDIAVAFVALSSRAKIAVLARTIHMETIHVRGAHLDHPDDPMRLYQSSEFIHRLSGFIMRLTRDPDLGERDMTHAAASLVEGIEPRGQYYLDRLSEWIAEAEAIS